MAILNCINNEGKREIKERKIDRERALTGEREMGEWKRRVSEGREGNKVKDRERVVEGESVREEEGRRERVE